MIAHLILISECRTLDFRNGVTSSKQVSLSSSSRHRLVHRYVTSSSADGGLGITPDAPDYSFIRSIFVLHDSAWNDSLLKSWSTSLDVSTSSLDTLKEHVGIPRYFSGLSLIDLLYSLATPLRSILLFSPSTPNPFSSPPLWA